MATEETLTNGSAVNGTTTSIRVLIIGAGSRGHSYAKALQKIPGACVAAVAEPIAFKRAYFGRKFIWTNAQPSPGQSFDSWQDFLASEKVRKGDSKIDAIFVCTLDETHVDIITAFAPLGLHIMSEKPLATTWHDCLRIYRALQPPGASTPDVIFSIGHVLRYSPHNMLLRQLLLHDRLIGDILSIEHTEPVGFWHFAHSYVRGNWRKESRTAPSLLTKSCHDIDLLLWLLCSPPSLSDPHQNAHLPREISSSGSLLYFKRSRKPKTAGNATNCLSCPAENECIYSADRIYDKDRLRRGYAGWPVKIIDPEIEDMYSRGTDDDRNNALVRLKERLAEDYDVTKLSQDAIDERSWYGRCIYEAGNDVCDDQVVNISWEEEGGHFAKNAVFHMVASTEAQCERRGRVYGSHGEISYDSRVIRVFDFTTRKAREYYPAQMGGGHGGGDFGLVRAFMEAVRAVKEGSMGVSEAQNTKVACTLEEIIRSHGMVFAAEEARKGKRVVDWAEWWHDNTTLKDD